MCLLKKSLVICGAMLYAIHLPSPLHFKDEAIVIVSVNLSLRIGTKGRPQINFKGI